MLVRFDTKSFEHASVGYALEGKHRALGCERCHTQRSIKAPDVLRNAALMNGHTYLGLSTECLACHEDTHRGQLGSGCLNCHSMDGWKPALKFSHDRAKFPLTGKHAEIPCASCHTPSPADQRTIRYVGLSFGRCSSCHADPHQGKFLKPCESCHTTMGWNEGEAREFDHATTRFPLRGRHRSVRCEQCHVPERAAGGKMTQVFSVRQFQRCADCHADPHRGEFAGRSDAGACESCHDEDGFRPSRFVHATARYVLEGMHARVACSRCHGGTVVDARGRPNPPDFRVPNFKHCADCHTDGHGGQFSLRSDGGACESCHTVEGFLPSRYGVEDHRQGRFPLDGAHRAVPCGDCHPSHEVRAPSTRRFRWPRVPECQTCHKDVHGGQFDTVMTRGCETCHSSDAWQTLRFSHDATRFPLRGKHVAVPCSGCHTAIDDGTSGRRVRYAGTPRRCVDCHSSSSVIGSTAEGDQ